MNKFPGEENNGSSGITVESCMFENGANREKIPMTEFTPSSVGDHNDFVIEEDETGHDGARSDVEAATTKRLLEEVIVSRKKATVVNALIFVLTPILALPLIFCVDEPHSKAARCGYVVIVMAVYWITEVAPLAVTALLPVPLFPMLGVMSAKETSNAYINDTCLLSIGALTVAVAIEVWDVHKRLALLVIRQVGSEPKRLLLGVSLVTWALAIFISNTATTAMMLVTATSLLHMYKGVLAVNSRMNARQEEEFVTNFSKAMCLTVAYSSSIGGTGSAIGAGPCMIFFATATEMYETKGIKMPITFGSWLLFGVPLSLLVLLTQWTWLVIRFLKFRCRDCRFGCCRKGVDKEAAGMKVLIENEYRKLGPISYAQKNVLIIFFLMIVSWLTRDIGGAGGWSSLFPPKTVSDSTTSIFFAVLMFVLPSKSPFRRGTRKGLFSTYRPLLQWQDSHEKMPWSLYLLLGGGFALAKGCSESGLSTLLGDQLFVFKGLNKWLILLVLCCLTTLTTEIMSNTATATLLMPVLKQLALSMGTNPLFYMFPASISAVYAFMLPAATPPNAIVFSKGYLRVTDMLSTGVLLNLTAIPLLLFATATWGTAMFDLDVVPPEFMQNATIV